MAIPILDIDNIYVISIQNELDDISASELKEELINRIYSKMPIGVVIDLSGLEIVDSFLGRIFIDISRNVKIMGSQVILCGITPPLAITIVKMGLPISSFKVAQDLSQAINLIKGINII